MKLIILKVCSSSTKPNTSSWTTIFLANLMNFESLWYNMENVKFFGQSFVKGLSWFSFQKYALTLCNMVNLKKNVCKSSVWLERQSSIMFPLSFTLWGIQNVAFKIAKWIWKLFFASFPFVTQNCGYTTPKAIIMSCVGNR